jgi:hypothetical protein
LTLVIFPVETPAALAISDRTCTCSALVKFDQPFSRPPNCLFARAFSVSAGSRSQASSQSRVKRPALKRKAIRHFQGPLFLTAGPGSSNDNIFLNSEEWPHHLLSSLLCALDARETGFNRGGLAGAYCRSRFEGRHSSRGRDCSPRRRPSCES